MRRSECISAMIVQHLLLALISTGLLLLPTLSPAQSASVGQGSGGKSWPARYSRYAGAIDRFSYEGPQPFNVLHYALDFRLPMTNDSLSGTSQLTLQMREAVDSVVLHGVGLQLDTVLVDGIIRPYSQNVPMETFAVFLGSVRNPGDTVSIRISYSRIPGFPRPGSRKGYYFFRDTLGLPSNLGYTFAEPSDARFWFPCYDEPWDKATADINITVPPGYVAASNGRFMGKTVNGNGSVRWQWKETNQIATYLICLTVSEFTVSSVPFVRGVNDTVPLQYYAWPSDSAECASYLPTVHQMMGSLGSLFGPYPFDKYGMTVVIPFPFLGMEHQTITTMNRFAKTRERTVVHELAHQWWGDLVTCGTWPDVWLNEGFATYSEALWREQLAGPTGLQHYMKDSLEHFNFGSWTGAVYDPVGQGFNLFDDVVYSKGAWVLHTLRGMLGDSTFFNVLRAYRAKYKGQSATTAELRAVVDSISGVDYGPFFDQWVFGRGWPKLASTFSWGTDTLTLAVYQLQSADGPTYTMPITVRVYQGGNSTDFLIRDSVRTQLFQLPVSVPPDSVALDPDGWILKQIVPPPLSAGTPSQPYTFQLFQNFPNPFNPTTTIAYTLRERTDVTLTVYDLLGQEVALLIEKVQPAGKYIVLFDGSHLSSGTYFCTLQAGDRTLTRRMMLLK